VKPTKPLMLAATTVIAIVLSYLVIRFWDDFGTIPPVPVSGPITLAILAVAVFAIALGLRARFSAYREARLQATQGKRGPADPTVKPIDPLQAARALVLAKASGLVGAIFGGCYGGYGLFLLGRLDVDTYRSRAILCGLAFVAGVALMAAALFLERILRVPPEQPARTSDKVSSGA
jgi:Protein of unknown function (DUF3180)